MLSKWILTQEERDYYMNALKEDLPMLRAKAGISQAELCNMIGITRQTYSSIESGKSKMTWTTFLSLILLFDNNLETRDVLRGLKGYPEELFRRINDGKKPDDSLFGSKEFTDILKHLDEHAFHTLRTMILVEYARCRRIPGDVVLKAFDGVDFFRAEPDPEIEKALKSIREKRK